MIPAEAVEVAAKAHYGKRAIIVERPWSELAPMVRRNHLVRMRAALEAAAPHLLAEVWEAGFDYARTESWTPEANPYRTAK